MIDLDAAQLLCISFGDCPQCRQRGFVIGPAGGAALNIECAALDCRTRYNVVFFAGSARMGQVIGNGSTGPQWPSEPRQ